MEHGTTLLLGLEGVAVEWVELDEDRTRIVHVRTADLAAGCPACGVVSCSPKQNVTTAPKDLPYGEDGIAIRWHCLEGPARVSRSPSRSRRCRRGRG